MARMLTVASVSRAHDQSAGFFMFKLPTQGRQEPFRLGLAGNAGALVSGQQNRARIRGEERETTRWKIRSDRGESQTPELKGCNSDA